MMVTFAQYVALGCGLAVVCHASASPIPACSKEGVCPGAAEPLKSKATISAMKEVAPNIGYTMIFFDSCGDRAFEYTHNGPYCPDIDCGTPVEGWTAETVYGSFSNTKMVTAAVFMAAIVEPGLASLDSTLHELLPDIFSSENAYAEVTPRQIMSHTSGWTGDIFATDCFQTYPTKANTRFVNASTVTLEECIRQLSELPPFRVPGTRFEYTDNSFEVLALVMRRRTGMTFEDAFQKHIGEPLKMQNSSYVCPVAGSTDAHPHPADGLCTTAEDYSKFTQLMFRNGSACGGETLLLPSSVESIFSKETGDAQVYNDSNHFMDAHSFDMPCVSPRNSSETGYGLGTFRWAGFTEPAVGHPGALSAVNWIVPGKYAAYISMAWPLAAAVNLAKAIGAFEEENYPGVPDCTAPGVERFEGKRPACTDFLC